MNDRAVNLRQPAAADWPDVLSLVFGRLSDELRERQLVATLEQFQAEPDVANGLLEARVGENVRGAILIQLQPGRVASLWPPQTSCEPAGTAAGLENVCAIALLAAALEQARRGGVRLVQSLLPTDAGIDAERLNSAGFEHAADLLYLVSPASAFPSTPPSDGLQFEPYPPAAAKSFAALVERTYAETRDCPLLNGVRPIEDVLEGYRAVGSWSPAKWFAVRREDRDIGCLLLAAHEEHKLWELVYMGIVPQARGQRFGLAIARQAQWTARQAGAERLVLAVDAANDPAIAAYAAAGFVGWDRRSVFLKVIS